MKPDYWHQRAATWVSASVLVGGLVTAVLLFILVQFQNKLEAQSIDYLGENPPTASPASLPE